MKNKILMSIIVSSFLIWCTSSSSSKDDKTTKENLNTKPDSSKLTKVIDLKENSGKKSFDILNNITDKDGDKISVAIPNLPSYISYKDGSLTIDTNAVDVADNQSKKDILDLEISDGKDTITEKVTVIIRDEANDSYMTSNLTLENITKGQDLNISLTLSDADAPNAGTLANSINATISSDAFADRQVTLNLENGVYKAKVSGLDTWNYTFKTQEISPVISGENPQANVVVEKDFVVKEVPTPDPELDTTPPRLSSTNKSFETTVWNPLTLEEVTATDGVDGNVTVVKTGSADFNTAGTYNITYRATDSAGNVSSIVHTYVVNEALVVNEAPTAENVWPLDAF